MASEPAGSPISVVITIKNEAPHLDRLLESLLVQELPFEIVIVDALSRDRSFEIAQQYASRNPGRIRAVRRFGSRGIGRNAGVRIASSDFVAFIDGDCVADSNWLRALRRGFSAADVVAGRTEAVGPDRFRALERVELYQKGNDVTHPSCNLGYRRALFESLGGFDPRFITAEDIDLNLRAVDAGAKITTVADAIVYHEARPTLLRFLIQAFWNGYGRKQLTEKHGSLWGSYRIRRLLQGQRGILAWVRLAAAFAGYVGRILTGRRRGASSAAVSRPMGS